MSLSQRVELEADRATPGRWLLDALVAPLWLIGWLAFWAVVVVSMAARWCWAGVRLGWLDARAQATRRGVGVGRWPVTPRAARGSG